MLASIVILTLGAGCISGSTPADDASEVATSLPPANGPAVDATPAPAEVVVPTVVAPSPTTPFSAGRPTPPTEPPTNDSADWLQGPRYPRVVPTPREPPSNVSTASCVFGPEVYARSSSAGWPDYEIRASYFLVDGSHLRVDMKPPAYGREPADTTPPYLLNITRAELGDFLARNDPNLTVENVSEAWRGGLNETEQRWGCYLAVRLLDLPAEDVNRSILDGGGVTYRAHVNGVEAEFHAWNGGEMDATREFEADWRYLSARAYAATGGATVCPYPCRSS